MDRSVRVLFALGSDQEVYLRPGGRRGGGVGTGAGLGRTPKSLSKKLSFRGGGVATGVGRRLRRWPATRPLASASSSTSGFALALAMSELVDPSRFSSSLAISLGFESLKSTAAII